MEVLQVLNIGGWVSILFYFVYRNMWNKDNRIGLRIVILAYLLFLILISIWAIWYSLFIE